MDCYRLDGGAPPERRRRVGYPARRLSAAELCGIPTQTMLGSTQRVVADHNGAGQLWETSRPTTILRQPRNDFMAVVSVDLSAAMRRELKALAPSAPGTDWLTPGTGPRAARKKDDEEESEE